MEKGNNRSSSSKTNATSELKSKQDGAKYSRGRFKSENISPRPDARSKGNPQRNRESSDKRPRTRSGAFCERYRNEVAADVVGAEGKDYQKSRKVNLNYLLNFTLSPTDNIRRPVRTFRSKLPKYNKEQFLQANCQFIAREDGDYSLHCTNPDNLVEWGFIEEVRVPSQELPSCPICLYAPMAAKITRCGHIYCWPCILHYLALTDKTWQKCPICFEAIHSSDLKSVLSVTREQVSTGTKLSMCLMKREKGSMFPVPVLYQSSTLIFRMHDTDAITKYQKLLLASKGDVCKIINREREELQSRLMMDKDEPEACFTAAALELLEKRENLLKATDIQNLSKDENHVQNMGSLETVIEADHMPTELEQEFSNTNNELKSPCQTPIGSPTDSVLLNSHQSPTDLNRKGKGTFYFYQATDGQHIYLHGLNVKMLVKEFGSLEDSPPVIEGTVLELENISMTESVRNRLRYLQHIPLTCEFQVAELNMGRFLSKSTSMEFSGDVAKRHKVRNIKAREEKQRERHIQEVENKRWGIYPGASYDLNSNEHFPRYDSHNELPNVLDQDAEYEVQYPTFGISNLDLKDDVEPRPEAAASFAKMLKDGQVATRKAVPRTSNYTSNADDEDLEETLSICAPEYRASFSNAIADALNMALVQRESGEQETNNNNKKKKKKPKNRILFTTSMNRSS